MEHSAIIHDVLVHIWCAVTSLYVVLTINPYMNKKSDVIETFFSLENVFFKDKCMKMFKKIRVVTQTCLHYLMVKIFIIEKINHIASFMS